MGISLAECFGVQVAGVGRSSAGNDALSAPSVAHLFVEAHANLVDCDDIIWAKPVPYGASFM